MIRAWCVGALLFCGTACGTQGDLPLGTFPNMGPAESASPASPAFGASGIGGQSGALPCLVASGLPSPAHRYSFNGVGTQVLDSVGGSDGEVIGGAVLDNSGEVVLDGDDYVDLPNDILGTKASVSVVLWVTPRNGPAYWRIFDFGTTDSGEDPTGPSVGTYYLALTTETGKDPSGMAAFLGQGGPASEVAALTEVALGGARMFAAVVVDSERRTLALYFDGEIVSEAAFVGDALSFDALNNWLGRSQYAADPYFQGSYDEVRIYHQALSACEIKDILRRGPEAP